jgi:predicted nuclease of predicted toxin-antitoxin system
VAEIKVYTDEHIARAVIAGLRQRGVDVLTVPEAGLMGASDEEHLAFARGESRVILTQDTDFLVLASEGYPHAGLIYASHQSSISTIIRGIILIHQVLTADEMAGNIEFI